MFITIALLTFGCVAFLTIRDWLRSPHISPKSVQKTLKLISQAISLNDWDKASQALIPLIENNKGGREAVLYEIQVLRGKEQYEEALQKVEKASRMFPEELLFRLEEGKIQLGLNKAKEALEAFNVCAPIIRGETDLYSLALALYQAEFSFHCFELLRPWLETTQNGELVALAADALFEQKQFKEAISTYFHAMKLGFKNHRVFTQLGHAYRRLGNLSESEKIFRKLLERDSKDVIATLGLGACMQERGHYHKALLIYQSGLAWETKDLILIKQAAFCALRAKKYAFAQAYFSEVMQKEDPDPQTFAFYGLCLESQKKWQEAEQTYLKLIQHFPSYPHGYRALSWMFGVGLSKTLTPEEGINLAHIALKLKNDTVSWEILSACTARVGKFEKAYQIQLFLSKQDKDASSRARRQQALRKLRKKAPLDGHQVIRARVA